MLFYITKKHIVGYCNIHHTDSKTYIRTPGEKGITNLKVNNSNKRNCPEYLKSTV